MAKNANRKKKRSNQSKRPALKTKLSIQELISSKRYEDAVIALRKKISTQPTDDLKRLLGDCLIELEKYEEATFVILDIKNKAAYDYLLSGWCYIRCQSWDSANQQIQQSLQLQETANGYYWLAVCCQKDKNDYQVLDDDKKRIIEFLYKATSLSPCRVETYLWLEKIIGWGEGKIEEKLRILNQAFTAHDQSIAVRIRLARIYEFHKKEPHKTIALLAPFLSKPDIDTEALMLAFFASKSLGQLPKAIGYLERIKPNNEADIFKIALIKGNLLTELLEHEKALIIYEQVNLSQNFEDRILSTIGIAWITLSSGNFQDAQEQISKGLQTWLNSGVNPRNEFWLEGECYHCDFLNLFEKIYSYWIQNAGTDEAIKGKLIYFKYKNEEYETEASPQLLIEASELFTHPRLSGDLRDHLLEVSKYADSVYHHLNHAVWNYANWDTLRNNVRYLPENFPSYYAEFDHLCYDFEPSGEQVEKKFKKTERNQIHKVAIKYLNNCQDSGTIKMVFVPFYVSAWRQILLDGEMFSEVERVVKSLIEVDPDDTRLLFDQAYAFSKTKNEKNAEVVYKLLLHKQPENASVLHNLSLILSAKGDYQQALEYSQKAALLAPQNSNIAQQPQRLIQTITEQKKATDKQQNFLRTAPDRWPQLDRYKKRLLATLASINSFNGWDELERLSSIEEKYLRGHWRKLVETGMLIGDADGFQVNEYILPLVKRERSHSLVTQIVRADATIAFKPVFNSQQEYLIYHILTALFPNHLVFPNMSLQTIFQYERIKGLMTREEFDYYLRAQVDVCIVSTSNYLPIVAFEIDSPYHDLTDQQERDKKKNSIFQSGGVALLRLRAFGSPSEMAIREQIVQIIREWRSTRDVRNELQAHLVSEIDEDAFIEADLNDDLKY